MTVVSVTGTTSLDLAETATSTKFCRRIVTQGAASAVVTFELNGVQISLPGGTELNSIAVNSLTMVSGTGVVCFVITNPKVTNF